MKNTVLFTILIVAGIIAASATQAQTPQIAPGLTVQGHPGSLCGTVEDMDRLADAVEADGDEGYRRVMADLGSTCVDISYPGHRINLPEWQAVEEHRVIFHRDGRIFQSWMIRSTKTGKTFFSWVLLADANAEPEGEDL